MAKPFFDRFGLIVAEDRDRLVGFVHAGFGPELAQRNTIEHCHSPIPPGFARRMPALPVATASFRRARTLKDLPRSLLPEDAAEVVQTVR